MLLLLLCLCCAGAWALLRYYRIQRLTARIPTLNGALPLIGHAHKFFGDSTYLWSFIADTSKQTIAKGGVIKLWLGMDLYFLVTDPKLAQNLLNSCLEKNKVYKIAKPWLGEGLETATVSKWKQERKLLNPTFNQQVLDRFIHIFNRQSRKLVENLSKEAGKGEFNPQYYLESAALATICQTAMGLSKEDEILFNVEYRNAVKKVHHYFTTRLKNIWMHNDYLFYWTKTKKEQDKYVKILKNMSSNVINKRKENRKIIINTKDGKTKDSGSLFKAFLDLLLDLKDEGHLSDQDVNDQVDTFIGAGYDTVSESMLFILALIGSHENVQKRLNDELVKVFGKTDRDVTKEDLPKLVFLEAVIKETLRLYPVAPIVARNIDQDVKFGDYTFPCGTNLMVSLWGLQRSKYWGHDAESFRPERWLSASSLPENPNAFAAFSIGKRSCIGKSYAMMYMKTTVSHVLRHLKLRADHMRIKLKSEVLLKPASGHEISVDLRVGC